MQMITVEDYKNGARKTLPRMLFDFVDGGALTEATRNRNARGYQDLWLRGRAFSSTTQASTEVSLLGSTLRVPLMVAPTGGSGLLWPNGEAEVAKACADFGTVMSVSAGSIASMEEIADAARGDKWLQIFLYRDRGLTKEFVQRAKAAGYKAICVTTDAPTHGRREKDVRNGFTVDRRLTPHTIVDAFVHVRWWMRMAGMPRASFKNFEGRSTGNISDMAAYIASVLDPNVGWDDFSWLREQWDGPLIVKGVISPSDAGEAIARGADAIQVSNHGGRQLDGNVGTIDALPDIVRAVQGRVPVLLDGGVSRGTDILKAISLGATACLIGRSHLWGLAVGGRSGVYDVLSILEAELRNAMCIGGWRSMADLRESRPVVRLQEIAAVV